MTTYGWFFALLPHKTEKYDIMSEKGIL